MSTMHFVWRGTSSDSLGVVVTKLPPLTVPEKRSKDVEVPGRSGVLHLKEDSWDELRLRLEGYLPYEQGRYVAGIDTIRSWLTGDDWLELSDIPGRRYKARITDSVEFSPWVVGFADREFSVTFRADPFQYEASPSFTTLFSPASIANPGTMEAEPIITVTGSGDIELIVGEASLMIEDLASTITVDVPLRLGYNGETNLSGSLKGDWPILTTGTTSISWTGNVMSLTIIPNWRWI